MILNIIFSVCMYPVLPIVYFVMKSSSRPKKNVVLGVTIPSEQIDHSDVVTICRQYDKELKTYTLIYALMPIPFFFIKYLSINMSLWMIWLLLVICLSFWPYIKYHKKLSLLKIEQQWNITNAGKAIVDIRTAAEKIRTLKPAYFLPPVILSLIPCIYKLFNTAQSRYYLIDFFVLLSIGLISILCFGTGILIDRQKSEIISSNSNVNSNFNRAKKHIWSNFWLAMAWINTAFTFAVWLFTDHFITNIILFMAIIIGYTVIIIYLCLRSGFTINKIRQKAVSEALAASDHIDTDDDANWIYGMIYYNPNDSSFMVDKRIGMGTTVNMATAGAKWLAGILFLSLLVIPVVSILLIFEEFAPINLDVTGDRIVAEHLKTEYSINIDDIRGCSLINDLPEARRVMGTGMDNLDKGNFSVDGYGDCKLCLNPQNNVFIVIRTDQYTYIFSDGDNTGTKLVYRKIAKLL